MKRMWSRNEIKNQVNTQLGSGEVPSVKADEIIENMSGYSAETDAKENLTIEPIYIGACKNGNKITFVWYGELTRTGSVENNLANICELTIPSDIGAKLYPDSNQWLSLYEVYCADSATSGASVKGLVEKASDTKLQLRLMSLNNLTENTTYRVRIEQTFLLSENLISA